MNSNSAEKTYSLSIFLHKTNIKNYRNCLKQEIFNGSYEEYNVNRRVIGTQGKIFLTFSEPEPPKWQSDINQFTKENITLNSTSTNRAVVILKVRNRLVSITFGHGRNMIDENTIVEDFGIKVAANLVDTDQIKSINSINIEDVVIDIQRQSSVFSNQSQLRIDTARDILKEIAGAPHRRQGTSSPKFLVGTSSLKASKKFDLINILDDLKFYVRTYYRSDYKKNGFLWLDNIKKVKDAQILNILHDELTNSIVNNTDYIHIAANRPVDWSNLEGFFISGMGKVNKIDNYELSINSENYFNYIRNGNSNYNTKAIIGKLKRDSLHVLYSSSSHENLCRVYDAIIFECDINSSRYLLTHGQWFNVNQNYYNHMLEKLHEIPVETNLSFIDYDKSNATKHGANEYSESLYNKDLAESNPDFYLLDQINFQAQVPGNNPIEPCDIITKNKELIHVKRYYGSSGLSHLLSQGMVSANLLRNTDFREHINKYTACTPSIIKPSDSNSDFKVVYAIIHKDSSKGVHDILPFFSIVNFVDAYERLRNMEIDCSLKKINIIS